MCKLHDVCIGYVDGSRQVIRNCANYVHDSYNHVYKIEKNDHYIFVNDGQVHFIGFLEDLKEEE